MPMYHVGSKGMVNQFQPPLAYQSNNSFNFGAPPSNIDFQIDGLPSELGGIPNAQNISNMANNNGTQIKVKKVYHLQKTDNPPLEPNAEKSSPLNLPTPPPCNCENCQIKKRGQNNNNNHYTHEPGVCDCHACNPRRFCKCEHCAAPGHDPNCTCLDCAPETHRKRNARNSQIYQAPPMEQKVDYKRRNTYANAYPAAPAYNNAPSYNNAPAYQSANNNNNNRYNSDEYYQTSPTSSMRQTGLGFNKHLKVIYSFKFINHYNLFILFCNSNHIYCLNISLFKTPIFNKFSHA